jgi:hypothetical protein
MKTQSLLAVLFVVLFFPYVSFGEIYGWVDENGVKHYSNYPPPEGVKVISQDTEIRTEVAPVENELESDQADAEKNEEQSPAGEAPPEQSAGTDAKPDAPDTVVTEDDEREAFHRERIKQRTRKNTSPAPSLQPEQSDAARQNPRVERKRNLP